MSATAAINATDRKAFSWICDKVRESPGTLKQRIWAADVVAIGIVRTCLPWANKGFGALVQVPGSHCRKKVVHGSADLLAVSLRTP